jgi:hypothetical protein
MCTREELLEYSSRVHLDLTRITPAQIIYDNDGQIYVGSGRIYVYIDVPDMVVGYTYPELEPVYMKFNPCRAWMGTERRLQSNIEYIDLMISLILYTKKITERVKIFYDEIIDPCEFYDKPDKLVKRADGFKIQLKEKIMAEDYAAATIDLAHRHPELFDTWEEKLQVLHDNLPQPIFEEIADSSVFFSQ